MTMPTVYPSQCFVSCNSREGFQSYYDQRFSETYVDRLYILKGGPGTGKSHFMKAVARHARALGYTVTEILCSSDPISLDGVILNASGKSTVGILDGTAPHAHEPTLPGAREELVDLGGFWNAKELRGKRDYMVSLNRGKATAYSRAYACLRAAGEMDSLMDSLMKGCVHRGSLQALAARLLRSQPPGKGFVAIPALRRALGMGGRHTLHSYEACARTLILPQGGYGLGFYLTEALLASSEERGHEVVVSYDPLSPQRVDGLLYPDTGLCVLVGEGATPEEASTRRLSLRRYTDTRALKALRGELRQVLAQRESLTEQALHYLADASKWHFELEALYSAAMDFPAKETFTQNFCQRVFESRTTG